MTLPFTIDEFMAVFAAYNAAIWPFHIAAYGLALVVLIAVFVPQPWLVRLAFAALAVLWLVNGIGYHLMFFAAINPIAQVFAAFFVFQAVLLLTSAVRPADLRLRLGRDFRSIAGLMTLIYALAIYPVLGGPGMGRWLDRCSASHHVRLQYSASVCCSSHAGAG